jgi:hypothetical protein
VSDLTADDYARLATEIGMVCECEAGGFWREALGVGRSGIVALDADLPAYLAEPAQMVRIMDSMPMRLNPMVTAGQRRWYAEHRGDEVVFWAACADTPGEAIRDCAARALRP